MGNNPKILVFFFFFLLSAYDFLLKWWSQTLLLESNEMTLSARLFFNELSVPQESVKSMFRQIIF